MQYCFRIGITARKEKNVFYIGDWDKQRIISHYVANNNIKKVVIIYSKNLDIKYETCVETKYIELHQVKKHELHYELLQYVNKYTLVVMDELLVTQQRYMNEYNCIANFVNQTPHRLVFNYLPFIENKDDFMILLDFYNRVKYKGERFDYELFKDFKYFIKPVHIKINFHEVEVVQEDEDEYNRYRDKLFEEIGLGNPQTIPNGLSAMSGDIKYKAVSDIHLTARNSRYKNLTTFKSTETNMVLELPIKRQDFVEWITRTKQTEIDVLTSKLSIDKWYEQDYINWIERLEEFYDKANFFRNQRS